MLDAVRAGGIVLIMAASAGWYAYDHAGASQSRDDDVSVYQRGGGGGTGGGGVRGRHRLNGPIAVITAPVVRKDVPVHVDGIGTVQAFNTVTVRAQVDQRRYQAKLTQAQGMKAKDEAQLANVKLDLERFVRLGQFATQQSVDTQRALVRQLEAALQVDQANIDAAALELDYTTIRSPISGRTSVRLIDAGNIVRAGEAGGIVVVTQLQPISVAFSLPQQHLVTVNQAMAKGEVQVAALDADGKTVWEEGALSVVDNRIDVQTGTIRLKATFANPERKLWPGQFVNVRVRLDTYRDGNIVPAAAIQRNGSGTFAYVVDPEDRVELRPVRVGQIDGGIALVETGLEPGQRVVVTSQEQLRPGASVISTEAVSEPGADVSQIPPTIGLSAGTPPARGQHQRP